MIDRPHPGITRRIVAEVLDNWTIRGIHTDPNGRQSWNYLAYVPSLQKIVRVGVSIDDNIITTAFRDDNVTRAWQRGDRSYFRRHFRNLTMKDWDDETGIDP